MDLINGTVHGKLQTFKNELSTLPSQYVWPVSDRPNVSDGPNVSDVIHATDAKIPLIDMAGIDGADRHNIVEAIGQACQTDGFFQIKNHEIPKTVVEGMLLVAQEFFQLPTDDPNKSTRLSTSFNVRTERVSNWRDFLRLHCYPLENFVHEWPSNTPSFREVVREYSKYARELALRLLGAISESLGLARDYMEKAIGRQAQHMAVNYYPPCPDPLPGCRFPRTTNRSR